MPPANGTGTGVGRGVEVANQGERLQKAGVKSISRQVVPCLVELTTEDGGAEGIHGVAGPLKGSVRSGSPGQRTPARGCAPGRHARAGRRPPRGTQPDLVPRPTRRGRPRRCSAPRLRREPRCGGGSPGQSLLDETGWTLRACTTAGRNAGSSTTVISSKAIGSTHSASVVPRSRPWRASAASSSPKSSFTRNRAESTASRPGGRSVPRTAPTSATKPSSTIPLSRSAASVGRSASASRRCFASVRVSPPSGSAAATGARSRRRRGSSDRGPLTRPDRVEPLHQPDLTERGTPSMTTRVIDDSGR